MSKLIHVESEKHLRSLIKGRNMYVKPERYDTGMRVTHKEVILAYKYAEGYRDMYIHMIDWWQFPMAYVVFTKEGENNDTRGK